MTVELNLPGVHNVLNSLAAIAVAAELEIADAPLKKALAEFSGVDRRLQVQGTVTTAAGRVTFVDDYGHHPTELAATIAAARDAWPGRRLVVCFQPHRYTRTLALLDDFAQVLSTVDALILTNVYSAGETPLAGADGKSLARAVRVRGAVEPIFIEDLSELPQVLAPDPPGRRCRADARRGQHRRRRADVAARAGGALAGRGAEVNAVPNECTAIDVLRNEPLRKHTSWRVGGPADLFYAPSTIAELTRILAELPAATPVHWLGLGLELARARRRHSRRRDRDEQLAARARAARRRGACARAPGSPACCSPSAACAGILGPAAFFAGIPGTVGGALAMNAGAFGGETWTHVESVTTIDRRGDVRERPRAEFEIGYRSVRGPADRVVPRRARSASSTTTSSSMDAIKALLARRNAAQPLGFPSCGSVFRNPPGDFAGPPHRAGWAQGPATSAARWSRTSTRTSS